MNIFGQLTNSLYIQQAYTYNFLDNEEETEANLNNEEESEGNRLYIIPIYKYISINYPYIFLDITTLDQLLQYFTPKNASPQLIGVTQNYFDSTSSLTAYSLDNGAVNDSYTDSENSEGDWYIPGLA